MRKVMQFKDLLALIELNPIEGAHAAREFCDGTRLRRWQGSVAAFKLAQRLFDDTPLQTAFYNDALWADGSKRNFRFLLLHCHQHLYNDRFGPESDCAQKHADALQPYFDDHKTTPEEMLEKLKACGGWSGLKRAASPQPNLPRSVGKLVGKPNSLTKRQGGDDSQAAKSVDAGGQTAQPTKPVMPTLVVGAPALAGAPRAATKADAPEPEVTKPVERSPRNVRWPAKDTAKRLLIDMNPFELRKFIGEASSVGDRAILVIARRDDDEHGMIIWEAIDIDYTAASDDEA